MNFKSVSAALLACSLCIGQVAVASGPVDAKVEAEIRKNLVVPSKNVGVESVSASEIPGMYVVQLENGPLVYSSASGKYFIIGDLYAVQSDELVNLTERSQDGVRKALIASVATEDMIVFSPEGEIRGSVTVFTDSTCFYCQKLHREVPELNRKGVEVRYLAYPRSGVDSDSYRELATAWCSDNPKDALTKLKNREPVDNNVCADNPVADQYALGGKLGVRGTPAIVTESGQMIPGYQAADQLIESMGLK
ncbi:MAG: thiol:disulfide interchange protein DsbC [Halieaceae bacterium]|jgi:thiol:disulfide interchange protein DsbC